MLILETLPDTSKYRAMNEHLRQGIRILTIGWLPIRRGHLPGLNDAWLCLNCRSLFLWIIELTGNLIYKEKITTDSHEGEVV
jgi:hypothetical protein